MSNPLSNTPHEQTSTTGRSFNLSPWPDVQAITTVAEGNQTFDAFQIFDNPFNIEDLAVFDNPTLRRLLHDESLHLSIEDLASSLSNSSAALIEHIEYALSSEERSQFRMLL